MSTNENDLPEKTALEKLAAFCKRVQATHEQIRALISSERANVDKTLAKASKYELLKGIGSPSTVAPCYSEKQVEDIRIECLHDINNRLIASGKLIDQLVNDYYELLRSYRELETAAWKLPWSDADLGLIAGNARRKPLEYYLQQGYRITYQLNGFVSRIKLVFHAVDIGQLATIQKLRDELKMSNELDRYLREFIAYAVFIS